MPNKAVVGTASTVGGAGVAGAVVAISLYLAGSAPPQEIIIAYTTIVTTLLSGAATFAGVYLTKMEK